MLRLRGIVKRIVAPRGSKKNRQKLLFNIIYRVAYSGVSGNTALKLLALLNDKRQILSLLMRVFRPQRFLEIGVGSGDTANLFLSESKKNNVKNARYFGFDTFDDGFPTDETDRLNEKIKKQKRGSALWNKHHTSMASVYALCENYKELGYKMELYKGNTKKTLPKYVSDLGPMDMIFIDGGHSYNTVKSDYNNLEKSLKDGTVIIFDDFNCEEGVSEFIGELLCTRGGFFKQKMFVPGRVGTWNCVIVILVYSGKETKHIYKHM